MSRGSGLASRTPRGRHLAASVLPLLFAALPRSCLGLDLCASTSRQPYTVCLCLASSLTVHSWYSFELDLRHFSLAISECHAESDPTVHDTLVFRSPVK